MAGEFSAPVNPVDGDTGSMTDTAGHSLLPAVAGKANCITTLVFSNSSAVNTIVTLTGLASTNTLHFPVPAGGGGAAVRNLLLGVG